MPNVRAYGADATLKLCQEVTYGTAPLDGYTSLDFKSTDLSSEQPLGDDPLLGRGRNTLDPYRGLISDEGQIEIPFDLQGIGFWLTGLFGSPTTGTGGAATGTITFAVNPTDADTITLGGTVWTFVAGASGAAETTIAGTLAGTIDQLIIDLGASADAEIAKCTYTHTPSGTLRIVYDTAGLTGNTFTLAASAATVSGATLSGGGATHVWESGADEIPSYTVEIGHPKLVTPVFFRHLGTVMESLAFDMGLEGPANGRIQLVAQGEETAATTIDATTASYTLRRFSQGRGSIKRGGVQLAGVTGGSLTFSNNLERVRVIREDGKIEAADPTFASAQGTMTVRFDGQTLVNEAMNGNPVALEYGYSFIDGYSLKFELPRVFLPKSKYAIPGPGGVEASFDWRGAYDETEATLLRVHLTNNVGSYG